MHTIRQSIICRAVSAFILLAAVAGCGEDDDKGGPTDTNRADGSGDGSRGDTLPPGTPDGGSPDGAAAADVSTVPDFGVADLVFADTVTAADAGVKGACISEAQSLCYEFEPDYSDASIMNHCSPMMATPIAVCPADFMGARIGRCVSKTEFGTLHTVYYKRVDPRSAQIMCASKGGTWYAQ
jgi:hypothetical protein